MLKSVKMVNGSLWILNMLLCLVVAVYAFNFLIFPEKVDLLAGLPQEKPRGQVKARRDPHHNKANYQSIWNLLNPIEKIVVRTAETPKPQPSVNLESMLEIEGTWPNQDDPKRAAAFLKYLPSSKSIFASYGKPILDPDGQPISQLAGVQVVEVYARKVVFNVNGVRVELKAKEDTDALTGTSPVSLTPTHPSHRDTTTPLPAPVDTTGEPKVAYDPANYQTHKTFERPDGGSTWEVDAKERDWITQHQGYVLEQELSLVPYADGGVKIDSIKGNSIVAARGFMPGDVVKSVNGKPVRGLADAKLLTNDPAIKNASTLTVVVDRAGKLITMDYRLKK